MRRCEQRTSLCETCKYDDCFGRKCTDCAAFNEEQHRCYCTEEAVPGETCNRYERKESHEDWDDPESYYNIRKED